MLTQRLASNQGSAPLTRRVTVFTAVSYHMRFESAQKDRDREREREITIKSNEMKSDNQKITNIVDQTKITEPGQR